MTMRTALSLQASDVFMLSRLLFWIVLLASVAIWFGATNLFDNALFALVKGGFRWEANLHSVSLQSLLIALTWPSAVGVWIALKTPARWTSLVAAAGALFAEAIVLAVWTIWSVGLVWGTQWAMMALAMLGLCLELAIAFLLVRRIVGAEALGARYLDAARVGIVALAGLTASKAILLCLSPWVGIRT